MRATRLALTLFLLPSGLFAQSEAALRDYFEGRYVTVKIDMPATKDGVEVYPLEARPLDLQQYSRRIKTHGTALQKGDAVMVTLVRVKEKNIEFQLGGGGFGTLFDDSGEVVYGESVPKTKREKELEAELKRVSDKDAKKSIERELRDLRSERSREEAHLRAEAAQAEEARKARVRQQALGAGSRFNLRFPSGVPVTSSTPEAIMLALADYVEFADPEQRQTVSGAAAGPANRPLSATQPATFRKGMSLEEVASAFGSPESCSAKSEGALTLTTCVYRLPEAHAEGQFVDGVLVRYTIASE